MRAHFPATRASWLQALTLRVAGAEPFVTWLLLLLALASAGVGFFHPPATFLTLGLMGLAAVIWPLRRMRDASELLSPWTFVIASVLIGVTVRSAYLALGLEDADELNRLFLRDRAVDFFLVPGVLLVLGLALMAVAFFSVPPNRIGSARLVRVLSRRTFDGRTLHVVVLLCAMTAFVGFLMFVRETGGLDLLEPSRKRAVSPGLEVHPEYRGLGYLRFLSGLGATAYLALLVYYLTSRKWIGPLRSGLLVLLLVNASLLPFYASARADILWLLLLSGVILAFAGHRLRARHVLIGLMAIVIIFYAMTMLRAERQVDAVLASFGGATEATESLVLTRNLVDVTKTAHVINAVPGTLDYKYGETILTWLLAPIPRELWPEKPVIQAGPEVGVLVYGNQRAGVPPGFVAEMYWNFHLPGVVLGTLLLGLGLRVLHEKLRPRGSPHPAVILVYVVVVMRLGMNALGGTVGQAAFNALVDGAQVLAIVGISTLRPRRGQGIALPGGGAAVQGRAQ